VNEFNGHLSEGKCSRIPAIRNSQFAIRNLLLWAEVLLYAGAMAAYIWFLMPLKPSMFRWYHVLAGVVLAAAPVGLNLLHGDNRRDSGIRLDNLGASAREVVIATVILAGGIVAIGLAAGGFHWVSPRRFGDITLVYLGWGFCQQYLLQSFSLRRLRQAQAPRWCAVIAAACVFGLIHAPNWYLVAGTTLAGAVWCGLFLRNANIITLGLAHATLAVLLYHAWPIAWLHGMTIGQMYLEKLRQAGIQ